MSDHTQLGELEPAVWERLERIVEDFEDQWQAGDRPNAADFLKRHEAERQALLAELLHVDVEFRVRSGEDVPFDQWLQDFPELRTRTSLLAELVVQAISMSPRQRRTLAREELLAKFPECADEITARLAKLPPESPVPPSEFDGAIADQPVAERDATVHDQASSFQSADLEALVRNARDDARSSLDARSSHDATMQSAAEELSSSSAGFTKGPDAPAEIPASLRSFGDYQLEREIARGGMGVVYAAKQISLNRTVALKMIRSGCLASDTEIERFRREAHAAGGLRHPGVVAVHDVGEIHGLQYFSMDLIEGQNLADRLQHGPMRPDDAAKLMRDVASAVDHAHANGVLHRDLKPSNILIDSDGQPHITDFGLARQADDDSGLTMTEQALGTPSYMPPEQVSRRFGDTSPLSDVYSLGATLFEMLTGRPPFVAANNLERVELILNQEPPPLRLINSLVPIDLETICLKCLQKEPTSRYASAKEFAEDLQRSIDREPITARRTSALERAIRWCRRRPALASAIGAVVVLLCVILIGSPIAAMLLREERDRAMFAEQTARVSEHSMRQTLFESYLDEAEAGRYSRRVGQRFQGLEALRSAGSLASILTLSAAEIRRARSLAVSCMALPDLQEQRQFDVDSIHVAVDPDFRFFAFCENPDTDADEPQTDKWRPLRIQVRSATDGGLIQILETNRLPAIATAALRPKITRDRRHLLLKAGITGFHKIFVWKLDFANKQPEQPQLPIANWPSRSAPVESADSRWVIHGKVGSGDSLQVYELATGRETATWKTNRRRSRIECSPVRNKFAEIGKSSKIRIYRMPAWMVGLQGAEIEKVALKQQPKLLQELAHPSNHSRVYSVAWSGDGRLIAAGTASGAAYIWDTLTGLLLDDLQGHRHTVFELRFNPDASLLLTAAWDGTLRIWDTASSNLLLHTNGGDIHLSQAGDQIASIQSHQGTYKLVFFRFSDAPEHRVLKDGGRLFRTYSLAFSIDGTILASCHSDGLRFWNAATGHATLLRRSLANSIAFDPVTQQFVTATEHGIERLSVKLVDDQVIVSQRGLLSGATPASIPNVAVSVDGQTIAATGEGQHVLVWNQDRKAPRVLEDMQGVELIDVSRNGRWLAVYGKTRDLVVVDLLNGERHKLMNSVGQYLSFEFSRDGRRLVSGERARYQVWSTTNWKQEHLVPRDGIGTSGSIAHSPDGQLLAVAHSRTLIRLYNAQTLEPLVDLNVESQFRIAKMKFSHDGATLAVANEASMIHLWNIRAIQSNLTEMTLSWPRTDVIELRSDERP